MFKQRVNEWYNAHKPEIKETFETVVFVIVMVILIRFFLFELRWIPSGSMKPTLIEGDRIIVERFSRFYSTPKRGDIMVFYPPMVELKNTPWKLFVRLLGVGCKDIAYIKRVIGTPGDTVEIKTDNTGKSTVYVNNEPIDEPYIMSPYDFSPCTDKNVNCGPTKIPEGKYLMMGDNRGSSLDGRYWGLLSKERFIGRAVAVFWPLNRLKTLNH
jgi:signal peptidase I